MIVLGVDEAGYGPPLGPLVVAATCWRFPARSPEELWPQMCRCSAALQDAGFLIADSKQVYRAGRGWSELEQGAWLALSCGGVNPPAGYARLFAALDPDWHEARRHAPWEAGFRLRLPRELEADDCLAATRQALGALARCGVELRGVQARVLFPAQFNDALRRWGNKATVLSRVSLELLRRTLDNPPAPAESEPLLALCDKHGGRNHYAALLLEHFPGQWFRPGEESAACSVYSGRRNGQAAHFFFQRDGERHLVVALASLVAKYLRELAMQAWNRFWCDRLPHLKPTAGYPQDAQRFWQQTAPVREQLDWPQEWLWRER